MSDPQTPAKGNPLLQPTPQEPRRVSLDELKKKAEDVRNLAVAEGKARVDEVVNEKRTTALLIAAGVVVGLASIAYFIGSNAGRAAAQRRFDRYVKDPCGPFGPFGKDL